MHRMRSSWNRATFVLAALATMLFATLAAASGGQEIKGVVQAMPASGLIGDWTISGKAVCTDAATVFDQEDGPLAVGAIVEVKGAQGDTCFLATKIEVKSEDDDDDDDDDGPGQVEFKGPVQSMPASGFVGDWMIGGRAVTTTATTTIDQGDGPLVIGAIVEVKGTQSAPGAPVMATKLEVHSGMGGDDDDDDDESDGDITGPIESLPDGTFIGTWVVGGQSVIVLSTTRLDQKQGGFVVGAIVEVEGTPTPDGFVASKIKTKKSPGAPEPEDALLKIEGLIEALPADGLIGAWTVGGIQVEVTEDTKLEDEDGPFVVGAAVEVKGFPLDGGGIQATKIETESGNGGHAPAYMFFGVVEAMPPSGLVGVWTIDGKTVNVTESTELEEEDGPLAVGANVKVKGWLQEDGAIEAREIETVSKLPTAFSETGPLAIEYFNANLGHYFMTASTGEIAALDAGAFGGAWTRTGQSMKVGGSVGVCRFYGMPPKGPDSHFFTVDAGECQQVMGEYKAWTFENHAFASTPPVDGTCPVGLVPVHRFYNNPAVTAAMNHRYASAPAVIAAMLEEGWIDEGVVMCAQP